MKVPLKILTICCYLCALLWPCLVKGQSSPGDPTHWILIDRSGSMRGFFATDQMSKLDNLIRNEGIGNFKSYYFIESDLVELGSSGEDNFGHHTLLNNALVRAIQARPQPPVIWFITDNQSSARGETESDRELAAFYNTLRSDKVKRLYFFPLKLPFDGDLYTIEDKLLASYTGNRGLLVYALLLDEKFTDQFEKAVAAFEKNAQKALSDYSSVNRVVIKPIERETITAKLVSLDNDKLKVEGHTIVGTDFMEGQPIVGKFGIELTSNFGLIQIDEAQIEAKSGLFSTSDFSTPNPSASITPQKFKDFRPGHPPPPFVVTLRLEPMKVENTVSSILHSIGSKRGGINGEMFISITVPPSNFSPVEGLKSEFSTEKNIFSDPSPKTQERIYKIRDLMQQMLPTGEQVIKPHINDNSEGRIPVRLSVRYLSGWRAVLLIIPLIVLAALLLLAIWLYRRIGATKYRLSWNQEQYRPCHDFKLTPFGGGQRIEADRIVVASIKKSPTGITVRAKPGYSIDGEKHRQLNESGSTFNLIRSNDDRSIDFHFAQVRTPGQSNRHHNDGEHISGDDEYGAYGSSTLYEDNDDLTPPLIKMPTFNGSSGQNSSTDDYASDINLDDLYK